MRRPIMTAAGTTLLLGAALATGLAVAPVAAQTPLKKAERDELATVAKDDPTMAAAMAKARQTLPGFLALAAAPKPGMDTFSVKVAVREGETAEYFWIAPFTSKDGTFSGKINNKPRSVRSVKFGETITFDQSEIVDWMYLDGDKMKGNYTACALLKSASQREAEEFKKRFGLDCDS